MYLTEDIRRIEAAAGAVSPKLMVRAGEAAAALALQLVPEQGKDVLVLAGPGNNGGDAYEVAARLKAAFLRVTVVSPADPAKLPPDAADALRKWQAADGETLSAVPEGPRWSLVVDGLFGVGLARPAEGEYAHLIEFANAQRCPVLALDIPSGLASDSGRALGPAVRATHTVTFIALKPGLLTLDGPDHCGALQVADLGLDVRSLLAPKGWIAEPATMRWVLKPRPREFHKGQAGSVGILGGASGMVGAALLAGRAALKLGAGRVYVGLLDHDAPDVDPVAPELMLRHPDDALGQSLDVVIVGPGLGQSERAETLVGAALASDMPCVLDADALNILADDSDLRTACARRRAETLITPHPGEAARLLQTRVSEVQADRLGAAQALAERLNAHTVLKGNGSVLVARDGHWFVNTAGNPGMASAGMGDTLSGFLGALLAQGYSGEAALVLGVHLHGAAADALVAQGIGPVGLTAGELIEPARTLWNGWLKD
ncbi:MAG: sugar kinase [Betaproteobacteria bacterium SG8_39]|nr:MAG: sugar kinase [Betaproteobacteria bacterium SG8_39]